jgi:hypothetical protein
MEQVVFVIERQRPEALDRRQLSLRKSNRVRILAVELLPRAVEIAIDVFRLAGRVVIHVRLRRGRTVEVIRAPLGVVHRRIPAIAGRAAVVFPLEQRGDDLLVGSAFLVAGSWAAASNVELIQP